MLGRVHEDLAVPYEPWIEVCSQLVEHAPVELLAAHVERHGGEVSRLARNLARRIHDAPPPQASDPETERYLLFGAVAGLLAEVSASVPICVVLDDLHWADGQSVALLKHVARTAGEAALAVIVTYRDSDLGKDHPLTARAGGPPAAGGGAADRVARSRRRRGRAGDRLGRRS